MTSRLFPRLLLAAALLAGATLGLALPKAAQAGTYISVQVGPPPLPVEVVPAARPGYVWAPGFYEWRAQRYHWRPGHWVRARLGQVYVPARWHAAGSRWEYRPAHWRASAPSRVHGSAHRSASQRTVAQRPRANPPRHAAPDRSRQADRSTNRGLQQVSHAGRPARH